MHKEYYSIHKIFIDIHTFIVDYVRLFNSINENSNEMTVDTMTINLINNIFLLPATFNDFSQRADELQNRLQRQIRIFAQKRRNDISKGIDTDHENTTDENQKEVYRFDNNFKMNLEQFQNNISDKNTDKMIRYIRSIIDAFEFYEDIKTQKYSLNITFRLLPILQYIQKQLCCISTNIEKILDTNASVIEQHLRRLEQRLNSYNKDMRNKLAQYISRDIRPPVLVVPCPTNTYSPERFYQMRSRNAIADNNNSIQITSVSSEDSLSM